VNPIQFDRHSDLEHYPRPLESDLEKCSAAGVDLVFVPEVASMYFPDRSVTVTESLLSSGLCGAARPGHFDGVCTVVLKLFLLTRCDIAVSARRISNNSPSSAAWCAISTCQWNYCPAPL